MPEEKEAISRKEPYYPEDEIDLAELLAVLWRRKKVILLTTVLVSGLALLVALFSPKKYLISAQVAPGITGYDEKGNPIRLLRPEDLKAWVDKEGYLTVLRGLLEEKKLEKVKISATVSRESKVVTLELYWPDRQEGRKILEAVLKALKNPGQGQLEKSFRLSQSKLEEAIANRERTLKKLEIEEAKLGIEEDRLKRAIELKKADLKLVKEEIQTIEQKMARTQALIKDLSREIRQINQNTEELIRLRNALVQSPRADKLAVLMYTNLIQQNLSYVSRLKDEITDLEKQVLDLEMSKKQKEALLKKLQNQIETLKVKERALSPVEVVQAPFASLRPVKPKRALILAVGIVLGVFLGLFMAFFWEFISGQREKILGAAEKL